MVIILFAKATAVRTQLKILIACEESQAVCKEFRKLGHEAYSCDILECSGGHPEWHIKEDILKIPYRKEEEGKTDDFQLVSDWVAAGKKIKSVKKIKEQHLSAMMMTYELLAELKDKSK